MLVSNNIGNVANPVIQHTNDMMGMKFVRNSSELGLERIFVAIVAVVWWLR